MAKTGSFIKLDRGLKSHSLWLERPFSKGQAWVDLLLLAQGVDKETQYRGKVQHMESGTIYTSICFLTKRWGWSRNKVYRFLETLIRLEMVSVKGWEKRNIATEHPNGTQNGTTNGTIITVENWAFYQYSDTNSRIKNGTPKRNTQTEHTIECTITENVHTEKNKGRSAPDPLSGKNGSHLRLTADEGTVDDIPERYRGMFDNFADYWRYRNQ